MQQASIAKITMLITSIWVIRLLSGHYHNLRSSDMSQLLLLLYYLGGFQVILLYGKRIKLGKAQAVFILLLFAGFVLLHFLV